jgi:hypothetical protein
MQLALRVAAQVWSGAGTVKRCDLTGMRRCNFHWRLTYDGWESSSESDLDVNDCVCLVNDCTTCCDGSQSVYAHDSASMASASANGGLVV